MAIFNNNQPKLKGLNEHGCMPHLLLLRPPRRQPRVLAATRNRKRLQVVVLDPWELRYAGEFKLKDKAADVSEAVLAHLGETISRERPQAIALPRSDRLLLRAGEKIARTLKLPFVTFTDDEVARLTLGTKGPKGLKDCRLADANALARAAIIHIQRKFYDEQRKQNPR